MITNITSSLEVLFPTHQIELLIIYDSVVTPSFTATLRHMRVILQLKQERLHISHRNGSTLANLWMGADWEGAATFYKISKHLLIKLGKIIGARLWIRSVKPPLGEMYENISLISSYARRFTFHTLLKRG